jgi:glycosyltransferase involved in cell wall biosynthesis
MKQTSFDFEWLIVDDGSVDCTQAVVSKWVAEANPFPIRYFQKVNGGKHRAINTALPLANGEMFFIVDSDDYLAETAIEELIRQRKTLPSNGLRYAGIAGCRGYHNGQMIGTSFAGNVLDCTSLERAQYGIDGDKSEAFFTSVLRQYPFPEFEGEKFVTEAVVWDKMALDGYHLRYFNEIIYLCEYLEDGLTHQGLDLYYKNPQGYGCYLRQCRDAGKFSKELQRYFDVECYLHWCRQMRLAEISKLIGAKPTALVYQTIVYQLRKYGSACKRQLMRMMRKGKNL